MTPRDLINQSMNAKGDFHGPSEQLQKTFPMGRFPTNKKSITQIYQQLTLQTPHSLFKKWTVWNFIVADKIT